MKHRGFAFLVFLVALAAPPALAAAPALELPLLFSDGAVLQRDRPLPVWGRAAPGAAVRVELGGHVAQATAGEDGRWSTTLPALAAGGPHALVVRVGDEERRIGDVLVGEVWLASGQSNMEWPVSQSLHAEEDIAGAGDDRLRHFKVPKSWAEAPREQLEGGRWRAASPDTVGEFSAIGYAFARELRRVLDVPVGVIDSSWGGSSIEAWMDASMLGLDAAELEAKMRRRRAEEAQVEARVRARVAQWPEAAPESEAFAAVGLDDRDWAPIEVPAPWESQGYVGMDGVAWYRTRFRLSEAEAAAGIVLGLGQIDDTDTAWVNGRRVGGVENGWNVPRVYPVPASALRPGDNTLAVRVRDDGGGGGIVGAASQLYLETAVGGRRPLEGPWRFRTAQVRVSMSDDKNQVDTLLYNAMIHPLRPYPLAGTIWYQGESNASEQGAHRYRDQFRGMIQGWRAAWGRPDMPFLWVQLAPFHSGADRLRRDGTAIDSPWATLRESQSAALSLPATAQVAITDVGDVDDIHPRDKRTVGQRLARAARHVAYGEQGLVWVGPAFRRARVEERTMILEFEPHAGPLAVRGGGEAPLGFELAGANGRFHPAQARIVGDRIVLSSSKVRRPRQARYAWSDAPVRADLVGADGLPVPPFRTAAP